MPPRSHPRLLSEGNRKRQEWSGRDPFTSTDAAVEFPVELIKCALRPYGMQLVAWSVSADEDADIRLRLVRLELRVSRETGERRTARSVQVAPSKCGP